MVVAVDFKVIGEEKMNCGGRETRVPFALRRLPGVLEVLPNAKTQNMAVVIDPDQVTIQEIQARLKMVGFEALAVLT